MSQLYFRDRASRLEVAAVTFAAMRRGATLTEEHRAHLRGLLRAPGARVYGAQRFDDGSSAPLDELRPAAPHWEPFGGFVFVLPAVELVRTAPKDDGSATTMLAVNLLRPEDAPQLVHVLRALTTAPRALRTTPAALMLPRARKVEHIVPYDVWCERMQRILCDMRCGAYAKLVLARAKRFLFEPAVRHEPLRVLAAIDEGNRGTRRASDGATRVGGSYLFCLQLERGVAFLGNSPERLFHVRGAEIHTAAVAGTVRRDRDCEDALLSELWGAKNVREHDFVIQHISSALRALGASPSVGETTVLPLPRLMHLVTPISGSLSSGDDKERVLETSNFVFKLLKSMHPTPAVCGMPRERTLGELSKLEQFDRGLFAGPFGWFSQDESEFCVAIRSALVSSDSVIAYAGSGIVEGSESRSEWDETELKMSAFTDLFMGDISLSSRVPRNKPRHPTNGLSNFQTHTAHDKNPVPNGMHSVKDEVSTFDCLQLAKEQNLNSLWGGVAIEELCRNGVNTFFVAPGSRSAPLAVGVVRSAHARLVVVHDERSAGFMAVGYARATGRAAAVITSSGTAVANLLPAVVEAHMDNLPLMLLTADRPPELRDIGANQTIDQVGIFGKYTRWTIDVPCPTDAIPLRKLLSDVDHAVFISGSLPIAPFESSDSTCMECGPVHLNFMFREKLAPDRQVWDRSCLDGVPESWTQSVLPLCICQVGVSRFVSLGTNANAGMHSRVGSPFCFLKSAQSGAIVVCAGPGAPLGEEDKLSINLISEELGWPVFADVASGLRLQQLCANLIPFADQILTSPSAHSLFSPDVVLQFGERLVSKRIAQIMTRCSKKNAFTHIVVSPRKKRSDQTMSATHRILSSSPSEFIARWFLLHKVRLDRFVAPAREPLMHRSAQLVTEHGNAVKDLHCNGTTHTSDRDRLLELSARIGEMLACRMTPEANTPIKEPWLARCVVASLTYNCALYLGNSMPIRDVDMYAAVRTGAAQLRVGANRGASGIDGVLSSGIGFAQGHGLPGVVLLGDMSLLHDMNALHTLRTGVGEQDLGPHSITVVVVNNGGGAIFSMLPIAKHQAVFSPVFDSPHSVRFASLADMFGLEYAFVRTVSELQHVLTSRSLRHRLVEVLVQTSHAENANLHMEFAADVDEMVANYVQAVVARKSEQSSLLT